MHRFIALLLALVPIVAAVAGIKWMRDTLFGILNTPFPALWFQFFIGLVSFGIGLYMFGGFILHRDRKRNRVQTRFRK